MELVIGSAVSLFIQWLKTSAKLGEYQTLGVLLLVAVFAAAVYTYFERVGLWESTAAILLTAGAFYSFVISRFTPGSTLNPG